MVKCLYSIAFLKRYFESRKNPTLLILPLREGGGLEWRCYSSQVHLIESPGLWIPTRAHRRHNCKTQVSIRYSTKYLSRFKFVADWNNNASLMITSANRSPTLRTPRGLHWHSTLAHSKRMPISAVIPMSRPLKALRHSLVHPSGKSGGNVGKGRWHCLPQGIRLELVFLHRPGSGGTVQLNSLPMVKFLEPVAFYLLPRWKSCTSLA